MNININGNFFQLNNFGSINIKNVNFNNANDKNKSEDEDDIVDDVVDGAYEGRREDVNKNVIISNNNSNDIIYWEEPEEKKEVNLIEEYQEEIEELEKQLNEGDGSFRHRKEMNDKIAKAYEELDMLKKAERMKECSSFLIFFKYLNKDKIKLIGSNSCCVRLCPCCAWRRSRKIYKNNRLMYEYIIKNYKNNRFLFLTLTIKNCEGGELQKEVNKLIESSTKMFRRTRVKKITLGSIRNVEVTYNEKTKMFHPHLHYIIHTSVSLYNGNNNKNYISFEEWRKMWKEVCNLDYDPQVNIKSFKAYASDAAKCFAEVAKYPAKIGNLDKLDNGILKDVVKVLDKALNKKRCVSYSGSFKNIMKVLKLTEKIEDELKNLDDIESEEDEDEGFKILYRWIFGENRYKFEF